MHVCGFFAVMLEPLSTLCVSFFSFLYIYFFIADNISISIYIMCVLLCLFSNLSRRVDALQISIIIIIKLVSLMLANISDRGCF